MLTIENKQIEKKLFVKAPHSKSISNRALMLQALRFNSVLIRNLSQADDTRILQRLLEEIQNAPTQSEPVKLFADNSGTAYRFLCSYLACTPGRWILDGNEAMRNRPVGALVEALQSAGTKIKYLEQVGFPPLEIEGGRLDFDGLKIDGSQSSQFVSSILLALPLGEKDAVIELSNTVSSLPYLEMTIEMMQKAKIRITQQKNCIFYAHQKELPPRRFTVLGDWSASAVWFLWVAMSKKGSVTIGNIQPDGRQPEMIMSKLMKHFGVQATYYAGRLHIRKVRPFTPTALKVDCMDIIDLVPYLAVACVGRQIYGEFSGVKNLIFKESNRIEALKANLGTFARFRLKNDTLYVDPTFIEFPSQIDFKTYNDHRIAMALSTLCHLFKRITIDNPDCVSKSYPTFWEEMRIVQKI